MDISQSSNKFEQNHEQVLKIYRILKYTSYALSKDFKHGVYNLNIFLIQYFKTLQNAILDSVKRLITTDDQDASYNTSYVQF